MIRSMLRALWLLVALASLVTVACELEGCSAARRTVTDHTPTVSAERCSRDGEARCNANVPETCGLADGALRWWPTTPLASDGRPARCAGVCVLSMDGAASWCSTGGAR